MQTQGGDTEVDRALLGLLIAGSLLLTLHFAISAWHSSDEDGGADIIGSTTIENCRRDGCNQHRSFIGRKPE